MLGIKMIEKNTRYPQIKIALLSRPLISVLTIHILYALNALIQPQHPIIFGNQ